MLLTRPALALLDESTSALDVANEAALYARLKASGVAFVSVGHRPTLLNFHDRVLYLEGRSDDAGEVQGSNPGRSDGGVGGGRDGASWRILPSAAFQKELAYVAID